MQGGFVTYREEDSNGTMQYFILQKDWPNYVGVILNYPNPKAIINKPISSYNLWVSFYGTIHGRYIDLKQDYFQELEGLFSAMADWYYKERIFKDPKRYKKWRI